MFVGVYIYIIIIIISSSSIIIIFSFIYYYFVKWNYLVLISPDMSVVNGHSYCWDFEKAPAPQHGAGAAMDTPATNIWGWVKIGIEWEYAAHNMLVMWVNNNEQSPKSP